MSKFPFTKTSLTALPLSEKGKPVDYYDSKTPTLLVRVSNESKTFYLYRKIDGKPERIRVGSFPLMTLEQARKEVAKINALIASGANPANIKRQDRQEPTLGEFFDDYMERHAKIRKKTWADDRKIFDRYLQKLKNRRLSQITRGEVRAVHATIGKDNGTYLANRVLALVKKVFNCAIEWEVFDKANPCTKIPLFKEQSRDRFMQSDEIPRFFAALAEEENIVIRDYIIVSLLTGARRNNVLSMRWVEISFDRAEWRIPVTKNGESQTVPLVPEVLEVLRERWSERQDPEWVFPGAGKTGHLVEPKKGWERVLNRAGLENLRLHDLRRTMGSWQARGGASLSIIGKSLGHKSVSTTAIYARLDIDPVRDSMEAATRAMMDAVAAGGKAEVVPIKGRK